MRGPVKWLQEVFCLREETIVEINHAQKSCRTLMTSRLGTSATACTLEGKGTAVLHGDVVQVVKVPAWLLRPVPLGYCGYYHGL